MYPVTIQTISAQRDREMREHAAAWRRARQARSITRARPAGIWFTLIARIARPARNARSLAGQQRLHGPAAA
jgi:hypothetical protein